MIKNYLIKIFDREGKTKKEFVIEESTPKKALKRLMRVKFYTENQTLIGNIVSMTEEKQWFFRMTIKAFYERGTEITISKLDYKYYDYTEDEVYAGLETIGDISTYRKGKIKPFPTDIGTKRKPKTSRLKEKIDKLILKHEGTGVYYFITTGIDYNLKYFKSAIVTGDREYIENLIKSGKKVSIIVVSNYPQITSRVPLFIEYVPVEEYVSKHPSISFILKLKFSDLPE